MGIYDDAISGMNNMKARRDAECAFIDELEKKGIDPWVHSFIKNRRDEGMSYPKIASLCNERKEKLPHGWKRWNRNNVWLILNPENIPYLKESNSYDTYVVARKMRDDSMNNFQIAVALNRQGVKTLSGSGEWNDARVWQLLANKNYSSRYRDNFELALGNLKDEIVSLRNQGKSFGLIATEISTKLRSNGLPGITASYARKMVAGTDEKTMSRIRFSLVKARKAIIDELQEKSISQLTNDIGCGKYCIEQILKKRNPSISLGNKRALAKYFGVLAGALISSTD